MKNKKRLEILECSGTSYEIGYQYGQAAGNNIRKSVDALVSRINYFHKADKAGILAVTQKYFPLVERFDPELIEMLKGQAEGAGVPLEEIFALRCWFELRFFYPRMTTFCTSFAVTGKATRGGKTLIGQNFDVMTGTALDMVKIKRNDGLRQLSLFFWGGGELTLSSAGLGIVLNVVVSPAKDQRLVVPCCCLMPRVMRQKKLGDALGLLCAYGRSMQHYAIGSGEGEIFSVETRPDDFNVIQPVKDVLVHANHYLTERFKAGNAATSETSGSTYLRQQRMERLIDRYYGDLTVERMMEFLSDHHNYNQSICSHPDKRLPEQMHGETAASVIMVPEDRLMYVSYGPPCENEFEEYKL